MREGEAGKLSQKINHIFLLIFTANLIRLQFERRNAEESWELGRLFFTSLQFSTWRKGKRLMPSGQFPEKYDTFNFSHSFS